MGYEDYIFYEPKQSRHICPQCTLIYLDARKAPCGHTLCASCYQEKDHLKYCPLCPTIKGFEDTSLIISTEINEEIRNLTTWCEYEGCLEHVPLCDRDKHLKECKHKNDIKRVRVIPDQNHSDAEEEQEDPSEEEQRRRAKLKRLKRIIFRLTVTLCVYGVIIAATGLVPHDTGLLPPDTAWCGVGENGQFMQGI